MAWLVVGVLALVFGGTGVAFAGVFAEPSVVIIQQTRPPAGEPVQPLADHRQAAHPSADPVVTVHARPTVTVRVRYEVTGATKASFLSFATNSGGEVQPTPPIGLPWNTELTASTGFIPTITAQSAGDGRISCRIRVNGVVVSSVTSTGRFGVATCTGNVIAGP